LHVIYILLKTKIIIINDLNGKCSMDRWWRSTKRIK